LCPRCPEDCESGLDHPEANHDVLTNCSWKGDVRELANFIEPVVILSPEEQLEVPVAELEIAYPCSVAGPASTFHQPKEYDYVDALNAASGQISSRSGAADQDETSGDYH
jgi:DNA-binding NtrC family response regulator